MYANTRSLHNAIVCYKLTKPNDENLCGYLISFKNIINIIIIK